MTMPQNQDLEFIQRTKDNLDYINSVVRQTKGQAHVWEMTQAMNSFLGIVVYPKDRVLDPEKLRALPLDNGKIKETGLPTMRSSWLNDSEEPRNLWHLLRLLRNGIAHGHIDLLGVSDVRTHREDFKEAASTSQDDIAGLEIWNEDHGRRTWGTVLTIEEMSQALAAIAELASDQSLWKKNDSRTERGGRKLPPDTMRNKNRKGAEHHANHHPN